MMRAGAGSLALLAAALLFPLPAAAQGEPGSSEDIVVTGRAEKPTRGEVSRQAREISRSSDIYDRPAARFEDRLCPGVLGLKQDYAALVIDRIRYNAERLDMWLAKDDGTCSPNFIVAFVKHGQQQLADLEREHGHLFQTLTLREREDLLAEDGPARVWSVTQMRTRDGMPIPRRESLDAPPVVNMWMAHSKIYTSVREDITSVLVVFDLDQVRGKSLIQLADYATMRGFALTRETEGDTAMNTILGLFDGDGPKPSGLTDFDLAYLMSLYDWIPNLPAATKLLGVNRQLRLQEKEAAQAAAAE